MVIACTKLVARLENIRSNKIQLDQAIGEFGKFNKEIDKNLSDKTNRLRKLYGIRKEINKEVSNLLLDLLIESGVATQQQILLGTGLKKLNDFNETFKSAGKKMTASAKFMLLSPDFLVSEREISLTLFTVDSEVFGFSKNTELEEIYNVVKKLGLEFCPAEVGPQLQIQSEYKDQSDVIIFMKPIETSLGRSRVFHIFNNGEFGQMLAGMDFWVKRSKYKLVFVRE